MRRARIGVLASVPLAALAIGACGSSNNSNASSATPVPPKTASGRAATVGVESDGGLGRVLVDSKGRTLYLFDKDPAGKSACSGACAAGWPPLTATGKPLAGPGITASKLSTTKRSDGTRQVVYNGHPLYHFSGDTKPGDVNGQGQNAFGALWYVVSGAGSQITTAAPQSGGGGGSIY